MVARSSSARFRPLRLRPGPGFAEAILRMRGGALLKFEFDHSRPAWVLDGQPISAETVSLLLATKEIEADEDMLFPGTPAQVWRFVKREV